MQKYKVYINKECKVIVDNWNDFCLEYSLINAAGGLVYNSNNQLLMIFRNGKWDLPKGKLELGESIEECAIREVEEECGVNNLEIVTQLETTYHTYDISGEAILKRTYWFKMHANCTNQPKPQINEGITRVEWVEEQDVLIRIENSYGNIKDLLLHG
tara:strand:+ start:856 stop:1326 length:471 start_codon:yes stop_codon:yes gene_type:complete